MGCFSYTDDVALLTPSMTALRHMVQVAEVFAEKYSLIFNVDKYQFLSFVSDAKSQVTGILHKNLFIKAGLKAYHLGNLNGQGKEPFNVIDVISKFNILFNGIMSNSNGVHQKLFK